MKIICESKEEYVELMAVSRYIHDALSCEEDGILNMLRHLYLDIADAPNKANVVWVDENFIKKDQS